MGGEQAFDLLRAIQPDVPILLASGYDETDAATRTANRGFADFLKKPFSVDRLTEAVASALGLGEE
jgi:DNA-binding NtrC family response regulator